MLLAPTLLLNAGSGAAIARPTFSRDFAGEKTLNNGTGPAITFTRGSNATYFDASGTLRFAPNNHIRNSEATGATSSTLPTNWMSYTDAGTITVVGTGTENGMTYVDVRFSGTNGSGSPQAGFVSGDGTGAVVASSGQTWTGSWQIRIVGGSTTGLQSVRVAIQERKGDTSLNVASSTTLTPTSSYQRISHSRTLTDSTTARVTNELQVFVGGLQTFDITLRIAAPQLEIGSTATEYNPTTGTAYFGPRFDHDPATGASRGLLIEEARTNLLERSAEFDNAYWEKSGSTSAANTSTAPDGTTSADRISETSDLAGHFVKRTISVVSGTTYTLSVFAKAGSAN
jgi:hypothetical protein